MVNGAASTINQTTLAFQPQGTTRFPSVGLLDLSVSKALKWGGSRQVKLTLDAFNVTNTNAILSYASNNISLQTSTQPTSIVAPRVFRFGARITF